MKNLIVLFAVIVGLCFTYAVRADDAPTTAPSDAATTAPSEIPATVRGKVESVAGMVITVKGKKSEATVTTDANTTFTLDGKPATLADVKEGQKIVAKQTEGVATDVALTGTHKKKAATTAPADGAGN